ncbi:MAG: DUF177 domain-containing protein [Anaerolineae bacterium]|nr:DUF177 domain-containing protein [Anaerolineae bacterium]
MRYNVAQLMQEGTGSFRQYEVHGELVEIDENNPGPVPIAGHITLIRTLRGILATGDFTLQMKEPCRRCLEPATIDASFEVEEEFFPSIDIETGASLPHADDDEPELMIDEHHILDLTPVLLQYAVVAGTRGGLCSIDCKGLCPICGANRNLEPCQCDTIRIDPRLAVLAQLLNSEPNTEDLERETE